MQVHLLLVAQTNKAEQHVGVHDLRIIEEITSSSGKLYEAAREMVDSVVPNKIDK